MTAVQHDTPAAIDFLRRWSPDTSWCLTAIVPDGKTETATFRPSEEEKAATWIEARQGVKNLYFHVNVTRDRHTSKPKKPDMAAFRALHVDIDPAAGEDFEEERQRIAGILGDNLPEGIPAPSVVIDSGGGLQAFWVLADPLPIDKPSDAAPEPWADGEAYNRGLELAFRADACHNCDRLMRLPGTVNLPNRNKASKGRIPTVARLLSWEGARYPLDAFEPLKLTAKPAPPATSSTPTASGKAPAVLDLGDGTPMGTEELREWAEKNGKMFKDATLARIATGTDPLDPDKYPSRSEALWSVVCDLVRADVDDGVIFRVITGPNEIAASVLDKPDPKRYALDQIAKAKTEAIDPTLAEMNSKHAVLLQEGGKTRVLSWERTELDASRQVPVLQSFDDFRNRYMHRRVIVGTNDKGHPTEKPLGKWWLEHPARREYLALRFFPGRPEEMDGYLNMWRDWAVTPRPGDWSLMREHIRRILANGDDACADYIECWASWAIQNPGEPAEVALVLKGGRGTGKGIFARALKHLFGQHGLQVNSPAQLTGRFNAHLRDCCLLFADEAIAPGDKAAESVLKGLITEPELTIEGKGVNLVQARNRLHVVMASNEEWVVPAGIDERRFAVFEVSSEHAQDSDYFKAIADQLKGGGLAAMLHDLLSMDLGDWHPRRNVPQTDALHAQKAASVTGVDAVFLDLLRAGEIPARRWVNCSMPFIATSDLRDYAQQRLRRDDVTLNAANKLLRDLGFEYQDRSRPRGFVLPPLPEARAAWDRVRMPMQWDDLTDWVELGASDYPAAPGAKSPF
ncbi:hypothetical protein BDK63_003640 [Halomonas campaniensis]|uniref:NrS-1 polymerase-like helicase domain-containing protein n=1 Tax=Halomonas campaniensis TaxID=213554 RepID=A0A7W5PCL7_9GAMM|nr:DUF5906 domain-containing protein [Halomonas campaniensis]MBB3332737.1 hypothetical protein [Halomonas campaniensis]